MINRRDLLKWGAVAPALAAGSQAAFARMPQGLDAILLDERFSEQHAEAQSNIPVMRFSGDVTGVWYERLDRRWRERGFVLGGITGSDALFVLETLAVQQGRRVISRTQLGEANTRSVSPVSWVIAPVHPSVTA